MKVNHILLIAVGGAVGAICRFMLGGFVQQKMASSMPWGTLTVNVIGCFLIGFFVRACEENAVSESVRFVAITGFLGAFTTFSTFGLETVTCLRAEGLALALLNVGSNVILGIIAVYFGIMIWEIVR